MENNELTDTSSNNGINEEYVDIVTIQGKEVFDILMQNGVYYSDYKKHHNPESNLIKPYELMMKIYGWKHTPVFACAIGKLANFYGAKGNGCVIMQLHVPLSEIRVQDYYDWVDIIYYMEGHEDFKTATGYTRGDFNDFCYNTLTETTLDNISNDRHCQVTVNRLEKKWLTKVIDPYFYDKIPEILCRGNYYADVDTLINNTIIHDLSLIEDNLKCKQLYPLS